MKRDIFLSNKIINKIHYKLSTLFISSKKKRKKFKKEFFHKLVANKLNKILDEHKEYWIFSLFFPWGDLGIACSLIKSFKEKFGGKVLVLVNNENRAKVARLFPSIDKVLVINKDLYDYIFQNPNFEIKKGNYFEINHWKFYNAPKYKSKHFLELYARMMNLEKWNNLEAPVFNEEIKQNVLMKIKSLKLDIEKTVFISKESNSLKCEMLSDDFWLKKAQEYKAQGYEVVINSNKQNWNGFKTIFLPMAQQLYFCSLCKKILAIRSGFNDLLGIMGLDNLEIYYPKNMFFNTIEPIEQLIEFKRAFKDEEDKSFHENMYRITSLKMFGHSNIEEILE